MKMIDLSGNRLFGSIPIEIFVLFELTFLNLSQNHLMGNIPENIGIMKELESIDLSWNHLFGEISPCMSNLTSLDYLDLSYNNFLGRIPSSIQLQSFDVVKYIGNPQLYGDPLPKHCTLIENVMTEHQLEKLKRTLKVLASIWVWELDSQLAFGEFVEVSSLIGLEACLFQICQWHKGLVLYDHSAKVEMVTGKAKKQLP